MEGRWRPSYVAAVGTGHGAPARIRTWDRPLRRRLLCPLSYGCLCLHHPPEADDEDPAVCLRRRRRPTACAVGPPTADPQARADGPPVGEPRAWSGRRDSNPRHTAWKAVALPAELLPRDAPRTIRTARGRRVSSATLPARMLVPPKRCLGGAVAPPRTHGRGGVIRTRDPLLPKQVRYQAALRPAVREYSASLSWRTVPCVRRSPGDRAARRPRRRSATAGTSARRSPPPPAPRGTPSRRRPRRSGRGA